MRRLILFYIIHLVAGEFRLAAPDWLGYRLIISMVSRRVMSAALALASSFSCLAPFWQDICPSLSGTAAEARSRRRASHTSSRKTRGGSGKTRSSSRRGGEKKAAAKPKYAYPLEFFMMKAPDFDRSPLDPESAANVKDAFQRGFADDISPEKLVRAGVFLHYPLSGGIFNRREDVKYIILHSTETGIPVPGKNVVNGWNSMGRRHPGAQYVVDRDGTIYQALDPKYGAVHVNIFKTLPGINNDNSIGIEMNHTGRQNYPPAQIEATKRLLTYLQQRWGVESENVITHRYAQQGDHTDPVNFDLNGFLAAKESFRNKAIALKRSMAPALPPDELSEDESPLASVYVQIHGPLPEDGEEKKESKSQSSVPASSVSGAKTSQSLSRAADQTAN